MELVKKWDDIAKNMRTLDGYLEDDNNRDYAVGLIRRGTCFIVVTCGGKQRFYPSRFMGYIRNRMGVHEANDERDGRVTNRAIAGILGAKPQVDPVLDEAYKQYCVELGFTPNARGAFGVERKYWVVSASALPEKRMGVL